MNDVREVLVQAVDAAHSIDVAQLQARITTRVFESDSSRQQAWFQHASRHRC